MRACRLDAAHQLRDDADRRVVADRREVGSQDAVRRHNLSLVLRTVRDDGEATRAGVAARLGLTRATVSSLVEQLLGAGLLAESGKTSSGQAGRPGTVLTLSRRGPAGLGVEINVDYVSACVVDLPGEERLRIMEEADNRSRPPGEVLGHAAEIAAGALRLRIPYSEVRTYLDGHAMPPEAVLTQAVELILDDLPAIRSGFSESAWRSLPLPPP